MRKLIILFCVVALCSCSIMPFGHKSLKSQPDNPFIDDPAYQAMNPFQQDLKYYRYIIDNTHPNPYAEILKARFDSLATKLHNDLENVNDTLRFMVMLRQLTCTMKDGHTGVWERNKASEFYPVNLRWFKEGWFITGDDSLLAESLLGQRVVRINSRPVDEVINLLGTLINGENDYWKRQRVNRVLTNPTSLSLLGISAPDGNLHLSLEKDGVSHEVVLQPVTGITWRNVEQHTPITYRSSLFWGMPIPEDDIYYVQFNAFSDKRCRDGDQGADLPDWGEFLEKTFATVDSLRLGHLVIDLRYNGGGNSMLGDQMMYCWELPDSFVHYTAQRCYSELLMLNYGWPSMIGDISAETGIPESEITLPYREKPVDPNHLQYMDIDVFFTQFSDPDQRFHLTRPEHPFNGKVILLTGSNTFSSAVDFATICQDNGLATLYGTPTGGKPSCFGDILGFSLPNTKINCGVSWKFFLRPDPRRDPSDSLYPDVYVAPTPGEYFAGRDMVWERVLGDIRHNAIPKPMVKNGR